MTETATTALVPAELQHAPTDEEIQEIRKRGSALVAYKKEVNEIFRTLEGLTWGSGSSVVKGAQFSQQTRYALAVFCRITGANPLTQVDILGGRPYLNVNYWSDKINSNTLFHHYEQWDISPSVEQNLQEKAKELRELADQMKESNPAQSTELTARAFDKQDEADRIREARISYSAPAWAEVVVETTVYRFIESTPIEKIQSGEITDIKPYLIAVRECNWAGGRPKAKKKDGGEYQPDPVGNLEPAKTARTRSLRRTAARSFAAWGKQYEVQIRKAEDAIEVEFEIIQDQREEEQAELPAEDEPQAVQTGAGEPTAVATEGAVDLPESEEGLSEEATAPEAVEESSPEPSWNEDDDRKRYFATLREAGIEDRIIWQKENGLPESTKQWGPDEYQKAFQLLTAAPRKNFYDGCEVLGLDPGIIAEKVLGRDPDTLADFNKLNTHLNALADGEKQQEFLQ